MTSTVADRTAADDEVQRIVDGWPPLTADQLNRIAVLLQPAAQPTAALSA